MKAKNLDKVENFIEESIKKVQERGWRIMSGGTCCFVDKTCCPLAAVVIADRSIYDKLFLYSGSLIYKAADIINKQIDDVFLPSEFTGPFDGGYGRRLEGKLGRKLRQKYIDKI